MELSIEPEWLCCNLCSAYSRNTFDPTYYQELLARLKTVNPLQQPPQRPLNKNAKRHLRSSGLRGSGRFAPGSMGRRR